jgi:hypothetical protein
LKTLFNAKKGGKGDKATKAVFGIIPHLINAELTWRDDRNCKLILNFFLNFSC